MNNHEAFNRFNQTNSVYINKIFWIAGALQSTELKDLLDEMTEKDWASCLPDVRESKYFKAYFDDNDMLEGLIEHRKFGFIAEVYHPKCSDFHYDEKGEVTGCSVSLGVLRISYVYGETREELMVAIEKADEIKYKEFMEEDKKTVNALAENKPLKKKQYPIKRENYGKCM